MLSAGAADDLDTRAVVAVDRQDAVARLEASRLGGTVREDRYHPQCLAGTLYFAAVEQRTDAAVFCLLGGDRLEHQRVDEGRDGVVQRADHAVEQVVILPGVRRLQHEGGEFGGHRLPVDAIIVLEEVKVSHRLRHRVEQADANILGDRQRRLGARDLGRSGFRAEFLRCGHAEGRRNQCHREEYRHPGHRGRGTSGKDVRPHSCYLLLRPHLASSGTGTQGHNGREDQDNRCIAIAEIINDAGGCGGWCWSETPILQ